MLLFRAISAATAISCFAATSMALDVGNWSINYVPSQSKAFACSMMASYKSGTSFSLIVNTEYQWGIYLSNESWNLDLNGSTQLAAVVDGKFIASGKAKHWSKKSAYLPFEGGAAFKALREGNLLVLNTEYGTMKFSLADTNKAMISTLDCVKSIPPKTGDVATNAAPPASVAASPPDDFRLYSQAESVTLLTNLLNSAGVVGYTILPPDKDFSGAEYVGLDGSKGFLRAAVGNTKSADDYAGYLSNDLSASCKGQFLLGKEVVPSTDGSVVRKLTTTCRRDGAEQVSEYTVIRKPNGLLLTIGTYGNGSQRQVNPLKPKDQSNLVNAAMTWIEKR